MVLTGLAAFVLSCDNGGGPKKSEIDQQIEKLNATWAASTVTLDGTAPVLDHSGFSLKIEGSPGNTQVNYTAQNRPAGPSPWNSSGILEFGETNVKQSLTRDDGIAITYSVTETTLVIDFTFSGTPYDAGRVANVSGNWHFEFTKQ